MEQEYDLILRSSNLCDARAPKENVVLWKPLVFFFFFLLKLTI